MKPLHERYLERQARSLSRDLGRIVKPAEVLELLIELAIQDEGLYDPVDGSVLSATRREAVQPTRDPDHPLEPAGRFAPRHLLQELRRED